MGNSFQEAEIRSELTPPEMEALPFDAFENGYPAAEWEKPLRQCPNGGVGGDGSIPSDRRGIIAVQV